MKKTLALLLAVLMVVGIFAGCNNGESTPTTVSTTPSSTPTPTEPSTEPTEPVPEALPADASDDDVYDYVLGEFYEVYEAAMEEQNVSKRFALEAIAEAKLLESGVMMPTTSQGGNYAISRVVPNTVSSVFWGIDSERFKTILITNELLKASDRTAIKELYASSESAEAYMTAAKQYLADHGYTLSTTYNVANSGDPQTWDVLNTYQSNDSEKIAHTFDGLMEYDQKNNLQPALAETYEVSEDGTVYTFHIREGVKWVDSQGREVGEVTADDWVAAMQHMMDAQGGLEYLIDGIILNATEYMSGAVTDFAEVGVKAVDKYTLEYTLTGPCSYFMTMLDYGVFAPMNRSYFLSQGGAFGLDAYAAAAANTSYTYGTSPDNIAYCGPFLITNFTAENSITFKQNESYWNKDAMNITEMNWVYEDGSDVTKTYTDMKSNVISGAGLNSSTVEIAKEDGMFDEYAYVSATDATAFSMYLIVKRTAFANDNDPSACISKQTDEQKEATRLALQNVHFRRALTYSVDRGAVNAVRVGEDLKLNNLGNAYTPGTFVKLEEDVTVEINGVSTTFPAGTNYGVIVQAQLDADGSPIKAYDPDADDGLGSSSGYDGWYNPEAAAAEMAIAVEQLKAQGVEISAENPIHLDFSCGAYSTTLTNQAQAYKKSIEAATGGLVIVDMLECASQKEYLYNNYYPQTGAGMNYNINTNTGWGPDYGDPKTYLDTMLPTPGGMCKSIGLY